jgi:hypothetical protein
MYTQVGKRPPVRGSSFTVDQTNLIRQFIAENAHRMIFSNKIDCELEVFKPRIIDHLQYASEKEQWEKWHIEQSKIDMKYFST